MPFNGSGTFTLVAGTPFVSGTTISSTIANNLNNDFANNGLSLCLVKDGQNVPTANLPMGGFRFTGMGSGVAATDSVTLGQIQSGASRYLASIAGATTISGSVTPAPTLAEGMMFAFTAVAPNAASPTLNVSSTGAKLIFWNGATCTSSMWGTNSSLMVVYLSTSQSTASTTGYHIVGHSGFMPSNLLRVKGSLAVGKGDGSVEILAPGTDGQFLAASASASSGLAWVASPVAVSAASQAEMNAMVATGVYVNPSVNTIILATEVTASGTAVNFTSIPAGVRRITVMFRSLQTSGTSIVQVQLGDAGGVEATGYLGGFIDHDATTGGAGANPTTGFYLSGAWAGTFIFHGKVVLDLENAALFSWVGTIQGGFSDQVLAVFGGGRKLLSQELDRIRVTTVNGTDTFAGGFVNISYER